MRILIVTNTGPVSDPRDRRGSARRLGTFVRALAVLGTPVTMAQMVPPDRLVEFGNQVVLDREQSEYWGCPVSVRLIPLARRKETFRTHYLAGTLSAAEQPHLYAFAGREQAAAIARLLDPEPDIVFVFHLAAMNALLRSGRRPRNLFFDLDDVEHAVRLRYSTQRPLWPGKLAYMAHVPALIAAERAAAARSRLVFVCSDLDVRRLAQIGVAGNVRVVPNAVPIPPESPPLPAEPVVMFIGALDYQPNLEAAERLVCQIMPLLRASRPGVRLLIAGRGGENLSSRIMAPPDVEFLGFVPDLDALYARTWVVCCPIVNGGGTRVKLVEAAAYGRPIVASRIGAEGLDLTDGREILLRDDDKMIAEACLQLLENGGLATDLGAAARKRAQQLYDADEIARHVTGLMRDSLDTGTRSTKPVAA